MQTNTRSEKGHAVEYLRPTRLSEALEALHARSPSIIAGGTDWYPAQGRRPVTCDLLDITAISELRGITQSGGGWRIGAATTWADLICADLPAGFDGLKAAAREVGSVQIQNSGTIAGNLCNASPAADGMPPLLTLGAEVELSSIEGQRRMPLAQFLRGVRKTALSGGELLTALHIPQPPQHAGFAKLGARRYLVISIAMVAVAGDLLAGKLQDLRIAVGACAPVAQRLTELERALEGCSVQDAAAQITPAHLAPLAPIDDVRGTGAYRREAVPALIQTALEEAFHG